MPGFYSFGHLYNVAVPATNSADAGVRLLRAYLDAVTLSEALQTRIWHAAELTLVHASQAIFFTIVIASLSHNLGPALESGASQAGLPPALAHGISSLPPGAAIFAAMLGYDPISHLIAASSLATLPPAIAARITDPHFFTGLLAQPFVDGIRIALLACVAMCVLAGVTSALRGSDRHRRVAVQPTVGDVAVVSQPMAQTR